MQRLPRIGLGLVLLLALAARLAVFPSSHQANMSPDAAHFLNVARCLARGQGYSNPAAWPAWLSPERLPAPETFKDPGLPLAIAGLAPLVRDPFLAGKLISLLAGVLLPVAVVVLARRVTRDPAVALAAGLLAAGSPVLIAQSVRVMAESLFTLLLSLAFVAAAPPIAGEPDHGRRARAAAPLLAGGLLGLAFHVRVQAIVALPAVILLLAAGRPAGRAATRAAWATVALLAVMSPRLIRDLALFGTPLHSDAAAYTLWPLMDPIDFSHRLVRPDTSWSFALAHAPELLAHTAASLVRFVRSALPRDILGHVVWAPALAAGIVLGVRRWRTWGFAWAYLVPVVLAMSVVSWNTRYFASTGPLWFLLTALGGMWLVRRLPAIHWPLAARVFGTVVLLGLIGLQTHRALREVRGYRPAEIAAAIAEAPILAARTGRDEALMVVTTSYWSWFADRPSVHLVIAGDEDVAAVIRRHRVRWAALPTSRLEELAARFPGGRLPQMLVPDHADGARDITVFAVREAPGAAGGGDPAPGGPPTEEGSTR